MRGFARAASIVFLARNLSEVLLGSCSCLSWLFERTDTRAFCFLNIISETDVVLLIEIVFISLELYAIAR